MAKFRSASDSVRREAQADFQRALSAAGRGQLQSPLELLGNNATASARIESDARQRVFNAREQYLHYRGQAYTSIKPIANRIAGQPIRLGLIQSKSRGKSDGEFRTRSLDCETPGWVKSLALKSGEELRIVESHPVLDALHNPAPELLGFTDWALKGVTVASLEITGIAYWWIRVVKGKPEIWPLPSHWARPRHDGGKLFTGWDILPDGVEDPIPADRNEVVPFKYLDPSSPLRVLGPLEAGARDIMVNEFVTEAQKQMFQRGPHPTAVIKVGDAKLGGNGKVVRGRLRQFQMEQIRQAIRNRYGGMVHYGEPMILDRMIESMEPYGNKPHEMSFGDNAASARTRVEQIFGTSSWVAGASGLGSRAEAAVADQNFCYLTVNPKIELLSRVLTTVVLPLFDTSGRYVLFIEPARPNDSEMEQKGWTDALQCGAATINQYLTHVLRVPPVPWGDAVVLKTGTAVVPVDQLANGFVNNTHLGAAPAQVGASDPALNQQPTPPATQGEQEAEGDEADKAARLTLSRKANDDDFADAYATLWLKAHGKQEKKLADAVKEFFKQQGKDVSAKLEALPDGQDSTADAIALSVFDPAAWETKLTDAVREPFARAVVAGAEHEFKSFGDDSKSVKAAPDFSFGFEFGADMPPAMLSAVKTAVDTALAQSYWAEIQQTTKELLTDTLKKSLEAGDAMPDTVKAVKDVFDGEISRDRAKAIARSESTYALNAGQDAVRQELANEGVVSGKEWFATFDGRTRATHADADGQRRAVNEDFDVGGSAAKYPGDPKLPAKERVNCRCAAASTTAFTKRTRAPRVKALLCRGCEIHGHN